MRLLEIERLHSMTEEIISARIKDINDLHLQDVNELKAEIVKLKVQLADSSLIIKDQHDKNQLLVNQSISTESKLSNLTKFTNEVFPFLVLFVMHSI